MPNLTVTVVEVKSLGCLTAPRRRPPVRDPMVVIRAGSQRRSTKVQFNAGPDAAFNNQSLSYYGIAAATTMWVQCYDGANPTSDALVGELRASLADLLKYHTPKGIWLDLTESLASSRAVGRVLVVLDTDLKPAVAATGSPETAASSSLLVPPAAQGGRRPTRTPSPSAAMPSSGRRHPSVSTTRPPSSRPASVSPTRPLAGGGSAGLPPQALPPHRPISPSQPPSRISRPSAANTASVSAPGRRASSTPRPASSATPWSTVTAAHDHTPQRPVSPGLLSSTMTPTDSIPTPYPPVVPVASSDRLSSLARAKHLPSPLDHLDAVTLPSAATSTSVVADTTGTTLTYSLSNHSTTSSLLSSTTPPPQPIISARRHSLAHLGYPPLARPSSPGYSPTAIPAVPPLPLMYANHAGGDTHSSPVMGPLAMPEPTPFRYPGGGTGSPASSPRPFDLPPTGGSPNMFPSPTAYAQTPHVPSPYMSPAPAAAPGRVSPHSTCGASPSLAYPPALYQPPGGDFVTMPTDLGGHVLMRAAAAVGELADVPVYRGPVHYHPATPSAALMGGGDARRHSANAAMVQESLGRMDLNAKPLPYVPHQRPYVNPYVVPHQR